MNFILVTLTLVVLLATMVGVAALGTDRLLPARKVLGFVAQDGIALDPASQVPLIISSRPTAEELKPLKFSTSLGGYNRDEVDGVLTRLIEENERLRCEIAAANDQ